MECYLEGFFNYNLEYLNLEQNSKFKKFQGLFINILSIGSQVSHHIKKIYKNIHIHVYVFHSLTLTLSFDSVSVKMCVLKHKTIPDNFMNPSCGHLWYL